MANTHGESSMEEFAAKALPELEALLKHFKQAGKPEEQDDADATQEPDEDVRNTDKERVKELAHIIWHLANQIECIAYHNDSVGNMVTANAQCIRKDAKRIHESFRTDDLRDF